MKRLIFQLVAMLFTLTTSSEKLLSEEADSPERFVVESWKKGKSGRDVFSKQLGKNWDAFVMVARELEKKHPDSIIELDDTLTGIQDETGYKVSKSYSKQASNGKYLVYVSYANGKNIETKKYSVLKEEGKWRIDDIFYGPDGKNGSIRGDFEIYNKKHCISDNSGICLK